MKEEGTASSKAKDDGKGKGRGKDEERGGERDN